MYLNSINVIGRMVAAGQFTKGATDKQDRLWGRIACQRPGSEKDDVDFIPFVCWGGTARAVAKYCGKGKVVILEGRLQTRSKIREDGTYDNYSEVNCRQVFFGPDAKNVSPDVPKAAAAPAATMPQPQPAVDLATTLAALITSGGAVNPAQLAALLAAGSASQTAPAATQTIASGPPTDGDNPFA